MKKLTIMVLALPCLLLIACEQENSEFQNVYDQNFLTQNVESRSANNISLDYTTASGTSTVLCANAEVFFYSNSQIDLFVEFADGTTQSNFCSNIHIAAASGYILDVIKDDNVPFSTPDLAVVVCDNTLCYSTSNPLVLGTSVRFIVDDEPDGL